MTPTPAITHLQAAATELARAREALLRRNAAAAQHTTKLLTETRNLIKRIAAVRATVGE